MNYEIFRHTFEKNQIITLDDILIRFPHIDRKILSRWVASEKLFHVRRGIYVLPGRVADDGWREQNANILVQPSYISLEYALSLYHLIPEEVVTLTSITTKKTQTYMLGKYGRYSYRSILPSAFTGYTLRKSQSGDIACATTGKAIVDFLYFHADYSSHEDFSEWRINSDLVREQSQPEELKTFAKLFSNKRLERQIENFISFIWS